MGRKVYFSNEKSAHDFNDRIGAGGVELEKQGVSVNTNHASFSKDDKYGESHKHGDMKR